MKWIFAALALLNAAGFAATFWDKRCAQTESWRISEKALFLWAVCGGSLGVYAAMILFRHKTQKWYFKYGIPLIIVVQAIIAAGILYAACGAPKGIQK
ncbi:MAG: DUF1294 domain-containing protein [Pyramidobacter sp.]|nr:DUF1294 domain-containing protein [Pyramidobacter sp.]